MAEPPPGAKADAIVAGPADPHLDALTTPPTPDAAAAPVAAAVIVDPDRLEADDAADKSLHVWRLVIEGLVARAAAASAWGPDSSCSSCRRRRDADDVRELQEERRSSARAELVVAEHGVPEASVLVQKVHG